VLGATVNRIPIATFPQFPIELPPLDTQNRIASILMAYDNLIENNRRQIALLEEAAQRLYKEWFVDLRFPGHEDVEMIDGVPNGWRRLCVGDICSLVKEISKEHDRTPETKYIGLEHMPRRSICLDLYGDVSAVKGNKMCFKAGDILFGKIRPYFHKVGFAQCDGVASTDTIIMRANQGYFGLLLACVSTEDFVSYTSKTSKTGTKMPRANWDAMSKYPLLVPESKLGYIFENVMQLITKQIQLISHSNISAREARDRLLPKLMSGEVEV
jgi:type I restriction enzyme S subunit